MPRAGRSAAFAGLIALAVSVVLLLPAARAASTTDQGSAGFSLGTWADVRVSRMGTLELAPGPGVWAKQGVTLDAGPPGSADSVWARNPTILIDPGPVYRMWYTGYDGSRSGILYAVSPDGYNWTKEGVVLAPFDTVGSPWVVREEAVYQLWFQGGPSGGGCIYHATSADGVNWTAPQVALFPGSPGAWDDFAVGSPVVVRDASGAYRMYYVGTDGFTDQVGLATSLGTTGFVRVGTAPVLATGAPGAWDGLGVRTGSVLLPSPADDRPWRMYYTGLDGIAWRLGFAYSDDGVTWTKASSGPFLQGTAGGPDSAALISATYLDTDTGVRLYYTASDGSVARVGVATESGPEYSFASVGRFDSRIFDAQDARATWQQATWNAVFPPGTSGALSLRTGSTPSPDETWSGWVPAVASGSGPWLLGVTAQFAQYRIELSTLSPSLTPEVSSVTLSYGPYPPATESLALTVVLAVGLATSGGALAATAALLLREARRRGGASR